MAELDFTPEYKMCRDCQQELHHSLFYKSKTYHGGIDRICKKCKVARNVERNRRPEVAAKRREAAREKWRSDENHRQSRTEYQNKYRSRPWVSEHYAKLNKESYILRRDQRRAESGWTAPYEQVEKPCSRCQEVKPMTDFYSNQRGISSRCKGCTKIAVKEWANANPEKVRARNAVYKELKRDSVRAHSRASWVRHKTNPVFRLKTWLRSALGRAVKKGSVRAGAFDLLGYTPYEIRRHLEKQFVKGMSWENRAEWHIDHITPLSSFNIESRDDPALQIAWGLPNLRPVWAKENLIKHAKITHLI